MGKRGRRARRDAPADELVPPFEVVLWGYDKQQVAACLHDLTARLEDALSRADAVELLQVQLCDAQVEIEQLRHIAEDSPATITRLSKIMAAAEQLRERAERAAREAAGAGAGRDVSVG